MKKNLGWIFFVYIVLSFNPVIAGPWFTGPLLAPAGHTIPRGHTNVELYSLDIYTRGHFDENGLLIHTPLFRTFVANPVMSHGITDWLDMQLTIPYVFNSTLGKHSNRLADVSVTLGFQVLEQKKSSKEKSSSWIPDLRFAIQQTIPTGKFEHLNPGASGTDSTGLGSNGTQLALNFQYLNEFKSHYLRTRLSLTRLYSGPVQVHGLNSYGGTFNTQGAINTGIENDADLAFEFSLTQKWVAVMEGYVSQGEATRFNGIVNIGNIGSPEVMIGSGAYFEEALAPAIEYNFNSNVGLIGGVWFPVKSRNTSDYITYMLALNAYW